MRGQQEPTPEQEQAMSDLERAHQDAYQQQLLAQELETVAVAHARAIGVTWTMLSNRFGSSPQAWQQRYRVLAHIEPPYAKPHVNVKRHYTGPPKNSPIFKKKA
jgi:hypothetical protein